jgi:hypothetical protein
MRNKGSGSIFDDLGAFGALVNALGSNPGGDAGSAFPESDSKDLRNGAKWIPDEVTDLRRAGKKVIFHQPSLVDQKTWYWNLEDGTRIEHGQIS